MNMAERTERMKKYIFMNNFVIAIQIILVVLSIIFNFLIDDFAVFITVFVHIALFVVYNGIVENIVEYGYLRKKFAKICDEAHSITSYSQLRIRMYKASKNKKDVVSAKLILQSVVKSFIAILSFISLFFMISFE